MSARTWVVTIITLLLTLTSYSIFHTPSNLPTTTAQHVIERALTKRVHLAQSSTSSSLIFRGSPIFAFNSQVMIWGARITRTENAPGAFLDVQILAVDYPAGKKRILKFKDQSRYAGLMPDALLKVYAMECFVPGLEKPLGKLTFTRNWNTDGNAENTSFFFRCDVSEALDEIDAKESFQIVIKAVDGSVLFDIPKHNSAVGSAGPINDSPVPFHLKPHVALSVCVGGLSQNGVFHIPEFVQHYMRLGVEHFVLGFQASNPAEYEIIRNISTRMLEPLISQGIIALHFMDMGWDDISDVDRDIPKMHFYQGCLYHTKAFSEYVGNFDIDEFWMPYEWDPQHGMPSLLNVLDNAYKAPPECLDWCFIAFPSYSIWVLASEKIRAGKVRDYRKALAFRYRSNQTNYFWKKSIARTKNAFSSGFHSFGGCLRNGQPNTQHRVNERDLRSCGRRVLKEMGVVHHYLASFYGWMTDIDRAVSGDWNAPFVRDEYSSLIAAYNYTVRLPGGNSLPRILNRVPGELIVRV